MRRLKSGEDRQERGANLVEMALVLPLLALFLVAILDFGRAFNNYIIVTNAAREGARYASHFPGAQSDIQQATVREAADSGIVLDTADVFVTTGLGGIAAGEPITVEVEYTLDTIIGGLVGLNQLTLRSGTRMVIFGLD